MRRLALALGLIGLAGNALAADLPEFPPIAHEPIAYVPAFPTYFPWQGFYAGGQLTVADASADFSNTTQPLLALALRELTLESEQQVSTWKVLGSSDTRSAGFGGFAGYNAQFDNALLGIEVNYTHSNLTVTAPEFPIGRQTPQLSNGSAYQVNLSGSGTMQIHDFATLRARFGWVVDNFVPYATLGLAAGRADFAISVSCNCVQLTPLVAFPFTQSEGKDQAFLYGYSVGGGLDVALTRNLFGRAEYEFIQFAPVFSVNSHIHVGRVGLGLKF